MDSASRPRGPESGGDRRRTTTTPAPPGSGAPAERAGLRPRPGPPGSQAPGATVGEHRRPRAPGAGPDWAHLPADLLAKVAGKVVALNEAGWAAHLRADRIGRWAIERKLQERQAQGHCLFVFAMVCKAWREAQLKVGGKLRSRALSDVVVPGRVALAKWALAEGCPRESARCPWARNLASIAARVGNLELVRWLCEAEQGFPLDGWTMRAAARSGCLELVQWLRAEGCEWHEDACAWAAQGGHLELVKWLRAEGCPWNEWTCASAAMGGHLKVLQWLRGEGCPWDWLTGHWAAQVSSDRVLRWARRNGCEWNAATRALAANKFGYTDGFGNLV